MTKSEGYYLNLAARLSQSGFSFALGHFRDAKQDVPGGDDGIDGGGYFWVMHKEKEMGLTRVKRIVERIYNLDVNHVGPSIFPVKEPKILTVELAQDAFRAMLDEHVDALNEEFAKKPLDGVYDLMRLNSLLRADPHMPVHWWDA